MGRKKQTTTTATADRQFVSLAWVAARWSVSRQSVRRIMARHGKAAANFGHARNGVVRLDLADVLDVERTVQAPRAS
jgi:hypothetical protein